MSNCARCSVPRDRHAIAFLLHGCPVYVSPAAAKAVKKAKSKLKRKGKK
jgi:hypothetical protein